MTQAPSNMVSENSEIPFCLCPSTDALNPAFSRSDMVNFIIAPSTTYPVMVKSLWFIAAAAVQESPSTTGTVECAEEFSAIHPFSGR